MSKIYVNGKVLGNVQYGVASTGTEQIGVDVETETGEKYTVIMYLSPDSIKFTDEKLARLGYSGEGDIEPQIVGKDCRLCIKTEEYQGQQKTKVDFVDPNGGGGLKFKDQATASKKEQMLAKLKAARASNGEFPPPAAAAVAPPKPKLF